ncbi:hypothetical protein ACFL6I_23385 [candidate division KSB1 bacterium]
MSFDDYMRRKNIEEISAMPNMRVFEDPQKAYDLMNSWTQVKESYETRFAGKKVDFVTIMIDDQGRPRMATVHYRDSTHTGSEFIDLERNILLEEKDRSWEMAKHFQRRPAQIPHK